MNTIKKCPKCQKEVDAKATKCPYCQSDTRSWVRQHPIGVFLLFLIFLPIVISQINAEPTPVQTPAQQIHEVKFQSARILAKSHIEKIPLTSPSTAKYNPPTTKVDPTDPNLFEVSSYIDSQNGFGAMVRTYWSMKLKFKGEDTQESVETDANWEIVEFTFDGEKIK
ncbi:zinc ribbon domain-containing protein [Patescibacteria group bacterium]|nr:zinc ribbon domain-containing protein [Patescibacteria group bacterium]